MRPTADEVRRELDRVLASAGFANAGRMSRFLKFVVERALAGGGDRLKEYVIGVEVFDRAADYDPRVDAIVRVEAARLRAKLAEYYAGEGRADAVVLSLPKGGYSPLIKLAAPSSRWRRGLIAGALAAAALAVAAWAPWTNRAPLSQPRLAVLPFTPYPDAAEPAIDAVAMRITEGVTAELVRTGRFAVVASSAARAAAETATRPRDMAATLDADVLIDARLTLDGDNVRVEARAMNAPIEQKFWVDTFAGRVDDTEALERVIAAGIASAVTAVHGLN